MLALALGLVGASPVTAPSSASAATALHALFAADWERSLAEDPIGASFHGDDRFNDRWPDMSIEAIEARAARDRDAVRALAAIDKAALSEEDQLNARLFGDMLAVRVGTFEHKLWLATLDQMSGVHAQEMLLSALTFRTVKDYDDWLARLREYPRLVDQHIVLLRRAIRDGVVQPRVALARVPAQIRAQLVDDARASSFYGPFTRWPKDVPAAARTRREAEAQQLIRAGVVPALRRFLAVVEGEVLPAAPDAVGIGARPGGAAAYSFLVRKHTTTAKSPDELHATGLAEVARIRAQMEQMKTAVGFKGPLAAFYESLRTDPKHFPKTSDEILLRTRALTKKIDGRLVRVMKTMPRTPYGVEPVPDAIAPTQTTAYYSPPAADGSRGGTYFVNLHKPSARPLWEMVPLALHESVPGHHMQIALMQERAAVPDFRRYGLSSTAYIEGWGLYAESLGEDMSLYEDPYDRVGQLAYQMWRAVRLVVDTGMHSKGWTRERAIAYFLDNAPKTRLDVENEIDRYIVWPGQALAYKTGDLVLQSLRARAQKALGERFRLGELHDVILLSGPLPLDLLEERVNAWIARAQERAPRDAAPVAR